MIDTNSDPNENGMQIANTASHQSDLGRVHDKQKYTTTNRNTKKVEKTQQKKIVINPFFFTNLPINQTLADHYREGYRKCAMIIRITNKYNFTIKRNNCKQTHNFVENV